MRPTPRQVWLAEGSDISRHGDGATRIVDMSRNYFAPEAADAIRQQVAQFVTYRVSGQSIYGYIAECGLLEWRAEPGAVCVDSGRE